MGYTNVLDYSEGKQDWIDAGLPIESAHQAPSDEAPEKADSES